MPPAENATINHAGSPAAAVGRVRAAPGDRAPWLFYMAAAVILFTYFDVYHHYWFLKLVGGYVIKSWLPPALLLLFALWHIRRHVSLPNRFAGLTFPTLFLGAYILFGSISLAWHEDLGHAVKYGLMMFGPVMTYLAALLILNDNRLIEKVILWLFWAGVLFSAQVFYMYEILGFQSWIGAPVTLKWMWTQQETQEVLWLNYYLSDGYFAYTKTLKLIDEPAFGAMLAPLILFGFFRAIRSEGWRGWVFFISTLFLLYTLIGTASRSSFVAFIAALFPFLWLIRRKRLHVLLILVAIAALLYQQPFMLYRTGLLAGALASHAVEIAEDPQAAQVVKNAESFLKKLDASIARRIPVQKDGHIESMRETVARARSYPLLGYGVGKLIGEHQTPESSWHIEHNRYLFILATSGLLAVVPYILFLIALSWLAWKTLSPRCNIQGGCNDIGLVLFAALILFILQITNCGQERYYYWVFFGLAAAWIRNAALTESHENPSH